MATEDQVKLYLAYWFQLGKKVLLNNGREKLLPNPIFEENRYSAEFENCWQRLIDPKSGDCYLEGTDQTIQQLLSPAWEIVDCARCQMPIPINQIGQTVLGCPCADLPLWPNTELPAPRFGVDSRKHLSNLSERLQRYQK
ncbi:hypothetical protein [Gloeothece citriformis]|nr:hypothetical protein [Gloeothece citriformis]